MGDATVDYVDAPFPTDEAAGISVLTRLGAVEGNPDGTFRPNRTLNRAEFVKIVLLSHPRGPSWVEQWRSERGCFPDVRAADWFAPYVCIAKERGIIGGYPDGWFRPEQPVNYAEALKILVLLYEYELPQFFAPTEWFEQYVVAADTMGTTLEVNIAHPALLLTRGNMARLAAAFRAQDEGELQAYRDAERGEWLPPMPESSSSSSSLSSVSSVSSSVSSSSAPQETQQLPAYPAASRFLMLGTRTSILLDGVFANTGSEDVLVRVPELELFREIRSIERLYLTDENGVNLAEMRLATANNTGKRLWRAEITDATPIIIPAGASRRFGVVMQVRSYGDGSPNELFETKSFSMTAQGKDSGMSAHIIPQDLHTPMHQVTLGRVGGIRSLLPATGMLQPGTNKAVAAFAFSGATTSVHADTALKGFRFGYMASGVRVERFRIGDGTPLATVDCSMPSDEPGVVTCDVLPESLAVIPRQFERALTVTADVSLLPGATSGTLQLTLGDAGKPGAAGPIRWSDGTSEYTWVDLASPLPRGPLWSVQP